MSFDTAAPNDAWIVPGSWDGADVRIQLINDMTMTGDPWLVDLDWLRIKDSG